MSAGEDGSVGDGLLETRTSEGTIRFLIDRPPANALTWALIARLTDRLVTLAGGEAVPPVVICGAGHRFFSAGGDIREVEVAGPQAALGRMRAFHRLISALETYPAPVICAVKGYAVGGAVELLLFSDFVVAGADSTFGFPEINNGLLPAAKGIREAARRLGSRATKRLLFSGKLVTSEAALAIGLVDEVCAPEDVEPRALALAQEWGGKDSDLLAALKRSVNLTTYLTDDELEELSIADMRAYLARATTSEARNRFLDRKKSA